MRVFNIDTALIFKSRKIPQFTFLTLFFLTSVEHPYATTSRKRPLPIKGHLSKARTSKLPATSLHFGLSVRGGSTVFYEHNKEYD